MKLSVIIVNYNVRHFLEQALQSVFKSGAALNMDVWVVDNCSVDGSVDMVKKQFPQVKIIENKENVGFSKANNQAILQSNAEYVLLLNPDTVLQNDTLPLSLQFMDSHPECGGLGVRMIDGKGKFLPESKRGLPTPAVALFKMTGLSAIFPKSKLFGKYHLRYLSEFENHEVDVLSGAFMLLRKSVLDKVGLLDEAFFMYGEDIDLSYRITLGGYKNYYFADTTIIHYKGESTKKKSANYVKVFYNAMVLFARKHYSQKMAGFFAVLISFAIQLRALLALFVRFVQNISMPLADFALAYAGFFAITRYWELYNKFVHGFYPDAYYYLHIPAYIIFIIVSVFFSGGYDKPFTMRRVIRGAAAGALLVFALYAFLPKDMQFSRAILFLGSAWAIAGMPLWRALLQIGSRNKISFTGIPSNRILLVGSAVECNRIRTLMAQSMVHAEFCGFLSHNSEKGPEFLGNFQQLDEVVEIFDINMVIFSAADISAADIMSVMSRHANSEINFKIVPENSLVIIGSNSKNTPGELYSIDINFNISEKFSKRKRRIFDLLIALMAVCLSPLLVFMSNGRKLLEVLPKLIFGNITCVSYCGRPNTSHLPEMKKGVFYPAQISTDATLEANINLAYARDYTPQKDFSLIFKLIFR